MKKNIWFYILITIVISGMLSVSSCKRSKVQDPDMKGPAGFRISLSGTANPSTLYIPASEPAVYSTIVVRALNNDGSPVANHDVVFQDEGYGYFEGYKVSDVRRTDAAGVAQIFYFIPPATNIKAALISNVTATLVDDGRLDNAGAAVYDVIPIKVIPYIQQGVVIHGHVLTPAGTGVADVAIFLDGDGGYPDAITVTRTSGSYEFYVAPGWYGTITPNAEGYTFVPPSYVFDATNAIYNDIGGLDFVAYFESGNNLAADVTDWELGPEGGTQVVNVTNNTGDATIGYTVVPNVNWIHVSPGSGSTPGSFTITVDENTTGEDRSGRVIITATDSQGSSVTINITQRAHEVSIDARLEVDRSAVHFDQSGGTVTINAYNSQSSDNIDYIITPEEDWIACSNTAGTTDDSFTITVGPNAGAARSADVVLTITTTGTANSEVRITVSQDVGPSLAVSPDTIVGSQAGGESFTITVSNPSTSDVLTWTVTNLDSWIAISPTSGTTGNSFIVTIQTANSTGTERQGVITVTGSNGATATVTVRQQG